MNIGMYYGLYCPAFTHLHDEYFSSYEQEYTKQEQTLGFGDNKKVTRTESSVAANFLNDLEQKSGKQQNTNQNIAQLNHIVTQKIGANVKTADADKKKDVSLAYGLIPKELYLFSSEG